MTEPRVSAVVLAWGTEPDLEECVHAIVASEGVAADVILVDNGCTDGAVERLTGTVGVTVVTPGENLGYAAGCNAGAARAEAPYLAFINGDAVVAPDAIAHLVSAVSDDTVGLVSGSVRLRDRPEVINSVGNPVHYAGLSWAGGLGEPASAYPRTREVASASGAAAVMRADRFADLGGFCEPMFAYCEDTELSLRCWQRGWRVLCAPDAVVLHRYEFARNSNKFYLLERNRLFLLLTLYQASTLLLLAPALLGLELAVLLVATKQGWGREKLRGWVWLARNRALVRARRALVQRTRVRSDRDLAPLLTGDFSPSGEVGMSAPPVVRAVSRGYWSIVKRWLPRGAASKGSV